MLLYLATGKWGPLTVFAEGWDIYPNMPADGRRMDADLWKRWAGRFQSSLDVFTREYDLDGILAIFERMQKRATDIMKDPIGFVPGSKYGPGA